MLFSCLYKGSKFIKLYTSTVWSLLAANYTFKKLFNACSHVDVIGSAAAGDLVRVHGPVADGSQVDVCVPCCHLRPCGCSWPLLQSEVTLRSMAGLRLVLAQKPCWHPCPVLWQRAVLVSMVSIDTGDHAEVCGTCRLQSGRPWSMLPLIAKGKEATFTLCWWLQTHSWNRGT